MRSGMHLGRRAAAAAIGAVLIAVALLIAAQAQALTPPASKAQADRFLDRALEKLVARADGPSGVISVVQRGEELDVHRAGVAELGGEAPRKRMHMRIASTAKAMTGAVSLSLVDQGVLQLHDTVGQWLPDQTAAWHGVTLEQLLQHTSGIPDFTAEDSFRQAVGANPLNPPAPVELLSFVAGKPLAFPAGSAYKYSNSDNILVGLIVEAATGNDYPGELQSLIAEPFGLGRTYLSSLPAVKEPTFHGFRDEEGESVDVTNDIDFGGWAWASGGVVSTPGNLNNFIRGYVGGIARTDPAGFIPGAHSEPRGPGKNAAGMAIFEYRTECGTVYGHTGSILGYTQFMAATADGERSVTMAINTQYGQSLLPRLRKAEERAVCAALA